MIEGMGGVMWGGLGPGWGGMVGLGWLGWVGLGRVGGLGGWLAGWVEGMKMMKTLGLIHKRCAPDESKSFARKPGGPAQSSISIIWVSRQLK